MERLGDVTALTLPGGARLAVACDSLGAIGPKKGDRVRVPGYVVGRFLCRVPLMELLAVGAEPRLVVCTLSVEPEPTGRAIMDGIRDEMCLAGLDPGAAVLGSTEKNVPTSQTGAGVTALGRLDRLRWGRGRRGDMVVVVGLPQVGAEVSLDDPHTADLPTLRLALGCGAVGDVVPVGSRGIAAEATDLAGRSGCGFEPAADPPVDMRASAGPSTCFLLTVPADGLTVVQRDLKASGRPCLVVGRLASRIAVDASDDPD